MAVSVAALIIAGIYYFYVRRLPTASDGTAPTQAILLTAVKSDLLQIAQGERKYMALNSRCASFEELISSRTILMERAAERGGYTYTIECSGADFTVTARHPRPRIAATFSTTAIDGQTALIQRVRDAISGADLDAVGEHAADFHRPRPLGDRGARDRPPAGVRPRGHGRHHRGQGRGLEARRVAGHRC